VCHTSCYPCGGAGKTIARPIQALEIDSELRAELERIVRGSTSSVRDARRARIILLRAQGKSQDEVAGELRISRPVVSLWERRFRSAGIAGLQDAKGRGRKPSVAKAKLARLVSEVVRPPSGRTRWSVRTMASHAGVSPATVQRVWSADDIKPRRMRTHDHIRHGTITLFAALSYLDGKIISRIAARHTHVQWLSFLKQIDRQTPSGLAIHLIDDNYSTHKHPGVKAWLVRHPRLHMHFVPTSSSWLNLVGKRVHESGSTPTSALRRATAESGLVARKLRSPATSRRGRRSALRRTACGISFGYAAAGRPRPGRR
jgi:transposase